MAEDKDDHDDFDLHNDDVEANHHNDGDGGGPSSVINDHDDPGEGGDGDGKWGLRATGLAHLWVSDPITFSTAWVECA